MGLFSSLKKLLFASESVAKSGAEKAGNFAKEKVEDLGDLTEATLEKSSELIKDKTTGLRDALSDTTESLKDKYEDIKDKSEDLLENLNTNETIQNIKEKAQDVKDRVMDGIENLGETEVVKGAASVSEKVGDKVLDAGEDFMQKAKEGADIVGEKLGDVKEKLMDKAKEGADILSQKYDETLAKAQAEEALEAQQPKGKYSEDDLSAGGSLLDGTDDFFSKAAKYADGDYRAMSEGKITIKDERLPLEEKPPVKAAGFEDMDGDGDELIDDAIITED